MGKKEAIAEMITLLPIYRMDKVVKQLVCAKCGQENCVHLKRYEILKEIINNDPGTRKPIN